MTWRKARKLIENYTTGRVKIRYNKFMKLWQKYWLYFILTFVVLHLIRDIFQDLEIHNILSDSFVIVKSSSIPNYWQLFNSYLFGFNTIGLALVCLFRKRFGVLGYLTIILPAIFLLAWIIFIVFI